MKAPRLLILSTLLFAPGVLIASERFDGTWHTRITCARNDKVEVLTWSLNSVVENGALRGVMGISGQPGSFVLEGKIADDGSAQLIGSSMFNTKQYTHGFPTHKTETSTLEIKARFKESDGDGMVNDASGIAAGTCTVEFVKELVMVNPG